MWTRRAIEVLGDLIAGDGLATVLAPRGHMRLWRAALPWRWWRSLTEWCADRPATTRLIGLSQIALGGWMQLRAARDR